MLQHTLSVKEAAVYLKVQPKTIRTWIAHGKLPASRVGRSYIIPMEVVGQLISPAVTYIEETTVVKAHASKLKALLTGAAASKEAIRSARQKDRERDAARMGNYRV